MRSILSTLLLLALSAPALAVDPLPVQSVPEPGAFSLLGLAGALGVAVYLSKKRKK